MTELAPLEACGAAARHPIPLCAGHQRPADACAGGGLRGPRPAAGSAAARLSGARLFLAQGDAAAGRRGVPCRGARPAGLWPHDRLGRGLRRRPRLVSHSERGPGRAGAGLGARPPRGRDGRRARFRRLGRGLVRPRAPRRVPLGRADERALRRPAGAALRHRRQPAAARAPPGPSIHDELAQARPPAQALPMVLLDAARQ